MMRKRNKNKNKNKKIKKALISVAIIVILIILINIITLYCTPQGYAKRMLKYINSDKVNEDVMPIGNTSSWYSEYHGNINSSVVDKSAYYFATTLVPEYYKVEDSKAYYKKNKKEIKIILGVTKYEEFDQILKNVKSLQGENLEFEEYFIIDGSTKNGDNSINTVLGIQYKDNEVILFNLNISDKIKKGKTPVIYCTVKTGEYKVERKSEDIEKGSNPEGHTGKVIN